MGKKNLKGALLGPRTQADRAGPEPMLARASWVADWPCPSSRGPRSSQLFLVQVSLLASPDPPNTHVTDS